MGVSERPVGGTVWLNRAIIQRHSIAAAVGDAAYLAGGQCDIGIDIYPLLKPRARRMAIADDLARIDRSSIDIQARLSICLVARTDIRQEAGVGERDVFAMDASVRWFGSQGLDSL